MGNSLDPIVNYWDDLVKLELWYYLGFKNSTHIKCAPTEKLRKIFIKYSSYHQDGEFYMTSDDFVGNFLGHTGTRFNHEFAKILAGIGTHKTGLISFAEFQALEHLLCAPDAFYRTAFQLFDIRRKGLVTYNDFMTVMLKIDIDKNISINHKFIENYFGRNKNREITYTEFSQFLNDFHQQQTIDAFKIRDPTGSGYISSYDFQNIMVHVKKYLLTNDVQNNLVVVTNGEHVSFPYFMAFNALLNKIELLKRTYLYATDGRRSQLVTKDAFLRSAQVFNQITPLEIDILFQLVAIIFQRRQLVYNDLSELSPNHCSNRKTTPLLKIIDINHPEGRSALVQMLESGYRFALGSFAGAIGASCVYPIDLVKTRMQNQRIHSNVAKLAYENSWDCFKKVTRNEGLKGLYRGLVPQLCGVAPEKAIKLTINDFMRDKLSDKQKNIPQWCEIIAGACAGASQVIFTNPLEIVKIRLQVAGEIAGGAKVRAWHVVKELGLFGLYKGARACLLRDVPFSAIYFPVYAHTKAKFADEDGYNNPLTLLLAGIIAGIPAASLVTPADVIKTRLQVNPQPGQTTYTGIIDATRKIMKQEGYRAFWKGTAARVCRSSPQFGVTLATYELLQRLFYIDFGGSRPSGSDIKKVAAIYDANTHLNPDHIGGYSVAIPILNGIETKFGLCLPKFAPWVNPTLAEAKSDNKL